MPIILILSSALLYYFSFPNIFSLHGFFLSGWLFAVPFLWAIDDKPLRVRFWLGLVWGVAAYGLLVQWLCPITPAGYVLFVLALALQPVLFAVLPVPFSSRTAKLFYYPSLWVVSEGLRTVILGGFSWSTAYSQSFHPHLIQAAFLGGAYAVSWLMLFINTALFLSLKLGFRRDRYWVAAVLVFLLNWAVGAGRIAMTPVPDSAELIRVSAVQANVSREDKVSPSLYDKNTERHLVLTKRSVMAGYPDLVVWPETAFPDDILKDPVWKPRMQQVARNYHAYFLVGSALWQDGQDLNSALLISPAGDWKDIYAKRHLVPFSEYRPKGKDPLSQRVYQVAGLSGYDFVAGTRVGLFSLEKVLEKGKRVMGFGVTICSEEGYPHLFRELARKGAEFMVVMLNDGWFRAPEALMMHAEMGIFRAVETRRPVVRAANTGWTVMADHVGRVRDQASAGLQGPGFAFFDVAPQRGETPYVRFGDFFVFGCVGFVIITLVNRIRRKKENG